MRLGSGLAGRSFAERCHALGFMAANGRSRAVALAVEECLGAALLVATSQLGEGAGVVL